jgi:uncharacterized protein DUF1634
VERLSRWLLSIGVLASSAALAIGLIAWMAGYDSIGLTLMNAGLVVLMATPVVRVLTSAIEYARARDWPFTIATAVLVAILAASLLYASRS